MPIDKRLGVAASIVLSEELVDMLDDEMRRLRLPSRAAMIRATIEDYFSPADHNKLDTELKASYLKIETLEHYLESREELIVVMQKQKQMLDGYERMTRLLGGPVIDAAHEFVSEHHIELPGSVLIARSAKRWWQIWKRE